MSRLFLKIYGLIEKFFCIYCAFNKVDKFTIIYMFLPCFFIFIKYNKNKRCVFMTESPLMKKSKEFDLM